MKRLAVIWGLCSLLMLGAFGVLIVEDRHLGVPLPYSVPVAFAGTLLAAAALFAIAQMLLARRPVGIIEPARAAAPAPSGRGVRFAPEGVVLLDFSRMVAFSAPRP